MENKKMIEKQCSHDLLPLMMRTQQEGSFLSSLKKHLVNEKHRVLQQKSHRTSKVNHFRPTLAKQILKHSHHLVKHQNKVEANIGLHRSDKTSRFATSVAHVDKRASQRKWRPLYRDAYFTPKTREQIASRYMKAGESANHGLKKINKQLNFDLRMKVDKQNLAKHTSTALQMIESSSSISKCNSFSTFSQCPSRIYCKQKQQLVSLDEKVAKRATQVSGFTRHQLFSYYKSLLSFSHSSEEKYFTGFETMLNLMNIATNENTVRQLLVPFKAKPSFHSFIEVFERILQSSLRESVVDFFEIVLDGKRTRQLNFEELSQLLAERMSKCHARQIVEEIYFQLDKANEEGVGVQEIVGLCYRSQEFCGFMRGYCQETRRQRVSIKPKRGTLL